MGRTIPAGRLVFDQIDFILPGTINRIGAIQVTDLDCAVFVDNVPTSWPLGDGSSMSDGTISSGVVYFNEIFGVIGYYQIRFFPNKPGFWRIVVRNAANGIEQIREYDVVPLSPAGSGLVASSL